MARGLPISALWKVFRDFPGSPVIKTVLPVWRVAGSNPGHGTKIAHAIFMAKKKNFFLIKEKKNFSKEGLWLL